MVLIGDGHTASPRCHVVCPPYPSLYSHLPLSVKIVGVGDGDGDGNQDLCVCFGVSWCMWCVCVVVLAERGSGHNTCWQLLFVCRWSGLLRRLHGSPRLGRRCERQRVCCRLVEQLHPKDHGGRWYAHRPGHSLAVSTLILEPCVRLLWIPASVLPCAPSIRVFCSF